MVVCNCDKCGLISCEHYDIHDEDESCEIGYCFNIGRKINCKNSLGILKRRRKKKLKRLMGKN